MNGLFLAAVMFILTGILLPLVLAEFFECAPWVADRILRIAARRLPAHGQLDQLRHWQGELDAVPGKITKLFFALHVFASSGATRRAIAESLMSYPLVQSEAAASDEGVVWVRASDLLTVLDSLGERLEHDDKFRANLQDRWGKGAMGDLQQRLRAQYGNLDPVDAFRICLRSTRALARSSPTGFLIPKDKIPRWLRGG